jgi:HSP20 family molecular chaperone IbpA
MPTPKPAYSSTTPQTPRLVGEEERLSLQQSIRRRISERAYFLFEASGFAPGNDESHWLQAESEILKRGIDVRESGNWLSLSAPLPDTSAENVQICLEPTRVIVHATKGDRKDTETQSAIPQELFLVSPFSVEVDPSTAGVAFQNQKLTLTVKKRFPESPPQKGS